MLDGLQGEDIVVHPVSYEGKDAYGNIASKDLDPVTISDVLIVPDDATAAIEDGRPNAIAIGYSLYIPKGVDVTWYGASVDIYGDLYNVIGDPKPYPAQLVPTERNLHVRVIRYVG